MDIKKIVNSLVKKHKTRNPFEIIKGLNVILVSEGFINIFKEIILSILMILFQNMNRFLSAPMS